MKTTFHNWMLSAAVTSAAIVSSASAGALSSQMAATPLAGETPLYNRAVGAEDLNGASSGISLAPASSSWAKGLTETTVADTSRLKAIEAPQPITLPGATSDLVADAAPLDLNTVDAITKELLSAAGNRAANNQSLEETHALISTMGNGILAERSEELDSIAEVNKASAQVDSGKDWNADDPTSEYLDFNYRTYDFKQFFDTNSNTVAVKVDINRLVDGTKPVGLEMDGVIEGFFNQEENQSTDTLAASFEGTDGSLENYAATPEPSSMLMMIFGLFFFGVNSRRQRRRRLASPLG